MNESIVVGSRVEILQPPLGRSLPVTDFTKNLAFALQTPGNVHSAPGDADGDGMTRALNQLARRRGEIAVHIADSVVVLHGWTGSYHQKQLAQEAVKNKIGSRELINEIEVRR